MYTDVALVRDGDSDPERSYEVNPANPRMRTTNGVEALARRVHDDAFSLILVDVLPQHPEGFYQVWLIFRHDNDRDPRHVSH
jgi:hypothetical protein